MIQKLNLLQYHLCNVLILTLVGFLSQKAKQQEKHQMLRKKPLPHTAMCLFSKSHAVPGRPAGQSDGRGMSRRRVGTSQGAQGAAALPLFFTNQKEQSTF